MSNIIDSIQLSGVTYGIKGSGGTQTIELTQAQYDALVDKDPNTFYVITDAEAGDLTNYYTKSETNTLLGDKADTATTYTKTEVDTALGGKQATLVSGSNIKTINNETLLGSGNIDIQGGGKAIEAGRGISITTGETADTVSFDLPISATTNGSILIGVSCSANRDKSFVGGQKSVGQGEGSFAFGQVCKASQWSIAVGDHIEANIKPNSAAFGKYNKQTGGYYEAESATTLFSVGNGTADNARHNAFEIRQNGDIYLTKDGQDVKLQDQLGGGSITVDTALDSGSTNPVQNRVIYNKIDEVEEVTAAGLNALNDELGGKQDTLVSGTNIKTINNESILGSGNIDIQGGGKAIEAGRGISITTGETADTVSFSLPISAGTGSYSIAEGYKTIASFYYSHAEGNHTEAKGEASHAEGLGSEATGETAHAEGYYTHAWGNLSHAEGCETIAKNKAEHASGQYNVSNIANTTWGDSGNTLFSVGNGTSESTRHNAFEIRQNGDIYLSSGGTDIKLQDHLGGGGGSSYTAGDGIDITNNAISVTGKVSTSDFNTYSGSVESRLAEDEEVTAASLNTLNDKFGGLKLMKISQTDYDNLQVKDQNTLYIIVN